MSNETFQIAAEVVSVEKNVQLEKRSGGTYQAYLFNYNDGTQLREKIVSTKGFEWNPQLQVTLDGLSKGDKVVITFKKNGMYTNLVSIDLNVGQELVGKVPSAAPSTSPSPSSRGSFADNAVGMQVGNALTNAAAVIAAGTLTGTLEAVAEDILVLGEKLKANVINGKYRTAVTETSGQKPPVVDSSEPFEDL